MKMYEYKLLWVDNGSDPAKRAKVEMDLNELGADGWELTDVEKCYDSHFSVAYFKRPITTD